MTRTDLLELVDAWRTRGVDFKRGLRPEQLSGEVARIALMSFDSAVLEAMVDNSYSAAHRSTD